MYYISTNISISIINSECWGTFAITLKNVCGAFGATNIVGILKTK